MFGGADCTFKPFNQFACDHIEEEMFPFETWGNTYVGVKSAMYTGATASAPDFWRIVSACGAQSCPNGTTVTITPAAGPTRSSTSCGTGCTCTTANGSTTCHLPALASGQTAPWIEFQHGSSFEAASDNPVVLAQYFVSQSADGVDASGLSLAQEGDPSLVLVPPVEQWRTSYTVLAPATFTHNHVNLTVQGSSATSAVQVDGVAVPASEWSQIPGTNFYAAVHALTNTIDGSHRISSTDGSGIGAVVYGYATYVSYGYAGGLNLAAINPRHPGD